MKSLKIGTRIRSKDNPEWGNWTITKTPTPKEDWYDKRGTSGENILFKHQLQFWEVVPTTKQKKGRK